MFESSQRKALVLVSVSEGIWHSHILLGSEKATGPALLASLNL
jgi:hypothetical protein